MLKIHKAEVQGYENITVSYTILSKSSAPKGLTIIFPGGGYTVQAPLLHYATGIFLNQSFDVLHVNYQYNNKQYDNFSSEEITAALKHDVKKVIDTVLHRTSYEDFYLIGKSLGTIAISSELHRDTFQEAKTIWLTPLLSNDEVFHAMLHSKHNGLCFIGDNDHYYTEEKFNQLKNNEHIISTLIPNANHSLELDTDALGSVDLLKNVMSEIERF